MDLFFERIKSGCYTKIYQKEKDLRSKLSEILLKNYYRNSSNLLDIKIDRLQQEEEKQKEISHLVKRNAYIDLESVSEESDLSVESINDIKVENSIEEISDCETLIEVMQEEMKMDMIDLDEDLFENRKIEAQRALAIETFRTKKPETEPIIPSISLPKISKVTKNVLTIKVTTLNHLIL